MAYDLLARASDRLGVTAALLAALAACAVAAAPTQAATTRGPAHLHRAATPAHVRHAAKRRRHGRRSHRRASGLKTTAPTAQARAQALSQLTGLAPSQVVEIGRASCRERVYGTV